MDDQIGFLQKISFYGLTKINNMVILLIILGLVGQEKDEAKKLLQLQSWNRNRISRFK